MFGADRKEFPIFERSQVLLLRIKLLLNKGKKWGKSNNNLLPARQPKILLTFPPDLSIIHLLFLFLLQIGCQREICHKNTKIDFITRKAQIK